MSKISYDNNPISPVESVSISYEPVFSDAGDRLSVNYSISVRGKLLATKGSPTSSGTFLSPATDCQVIAETGINDANWLESLLAKRCALNNLFKNDYRKLSIGTVSATNDLTCYPRVDGLTFDESDNPLYWPFTINFSTDNLFCNGVAVESTGTPPYKLRSFSETWDYSYDDERVSGETGYNKIYNISHSVSAVGVNIRGSGGTITSSGVDQARNYVKSKIGVNATEPIIAISGFTSNYSNKYNYVDVHNVDVAAGSYSVTENWVCSTGKYVEEYTIDMQATNNKYCPTISINGTITGFAERAMDSGVILVSKYKNAKDYWTVVGESGLRARVQDKTGFSVYQNSNSSSVTIAPIAGTISYNYEFSNGPSRQLASAKWENISLSTNFGEDIYATIPILGGGEIIQKINTTGNKLYKTSLNIDALYPCSGMHKLGPRFTSGISSELQSVVNSYNPALTLSGVGYQAIESQSETWNYYDSYYNYSVTWVWNTSGSC